MHIGSVMGARLVLSIVVDAISFATTPIYVLRVLGWSRQAPTAPGVLVAVRAPNITISIQGATAMGLAAGLFCVQMYFLSMHLSTVVFTLV